jgi:hypothetical protein
MPKEFFHYPETANLFKLLEEASHRSGVSRGQAFEDFLTMSVCSLSGERMEELYLQTVAKHTAGKKGKRGCDSLAKMFAELVAAMEQDTREQMKDILGDLFEGSISYGEHSQYMTPWPVCVLMAQLTLGNPEPSEDAEPAVESEAADQAGDTAIPEVPPPAPDSVAKRVQDPCCGSGRMLLAAAQINRHWEFVGQDVDLRCVRMTALNLAFRNLYGYVIWGNTLALEQKLVYRTGFDGRGFIREIPLAACPAPVQREVRAENSESPAAQEPQQSTVDEPTEPKSQLRLF